MIEVRDLVRRFGPIVAVDGVSLTVGKGEVLGFLGPNGAGKTTTMRVVTGYLPPTGGRASVCGHDVAREPIEAKRAIGYLPEGAPLYPDMTALGLLRFVTRARGMERGRAKERIGEVVERLALESVLLQPIETLSKGYKRRVGLAQAIVHDPEVLILDEPTDGLDPNQKHEVRELIREMAGEKAIVLSTHILEEVEAVCTRAVVISRGKLVADDTPEGLRARSRRHNAVVVTVRAEPEVVLGRLRSLSRVSAVERLESENGRARCLVLAKDGAQVAPAVSDSLREGGLAVEELRVELGRLDDVFREITGGPAKKRAESRREAES